MSVAAPGFLELFHQKCSQTPDACFAVWKEKQISFRDLDRASRAIAVEMQLRGLNRGDRVAVMMRNRPEVLAILFGIARAGLVWVPINPEQRGQGLRYLVGHSEPAVIFLDEDRHAALTECGATIDPHSIIMHDPECPSVLDGIWNRGDAFVDARISSDELFSIMYTSGTTGRPKGVLVTHGMVRSAGDAAVMLADATDGDVLFLWEPLYHIGGAQVLMMPLLRNLRLAMAERFSASRFWEQVKATGATHIHYLGGILQMLMRQPQTDAERTSKARVAWGAGATARTWAPIQERFGIRLREAYGMTETSSIATFNGDGTPGSVGRTVPWFEVSIVDGNGQALPSGRRGEIVVTPLRSNCLFRGYYKDEDASRKVLRGGKMYTGDIGSIDSEGRLYFHGRMTDSVRCRGENVSALEVEEIVRLHPAVADCAVIGVDADVGEQEIKLFIQPKAGNNIDAAQLSDWLSSRLAPYQNPRYIAFVDRFQRTPSERIMKHTLNGDLGESWDRMMRPSNETSLGGRPR